MHPDIAREIIRQRTGDMRAQARQDSTARKARAAARWLRGRTPVSDGVDIPRIPDYVDGTFHEDGDRAHAGA